MNIYKLAQIVQNLAENGFENEADDLATAIQETPEVQTPEVEDPNKIINEILNQPNIKQELENIVGGILHELFEDPNSSEATLSNLPIVVRELVSD
jgi:hypothetical protein